MIRERAVLIDAGTTGSETGMIVGDVDTETVKDKARLLAPVPGGVGPVTIAMLFRNVLASAALRFNPVRNSPPLKGPLGASSAGEISNGVDIQNLQ